MATIWIIISALIFLVLCSGVAHEFTKELQGWKKYVGFVLAFFFAGIVFFLFNGAVPEMGR